MGAVIAKAIVLKELPFIRHMIEDGASPLDIYITIKEGIEGKMDPELFSTITQKLYQMIVYMEF